MRAKAILLSIVTGAGHVYLGRHAQGVALFALFAAALPAVPGLRAARDMALRGRARARPLRPAAAPRAARLGAPPARERSPRDRRRRRRGGPHDMKEACGLFGVYGHPDAARKVY